MTPFGVYLFLSKTFCISGEEKSTAKYDHVYQW